MNHIDVDKFWKKFLNRIWSKKAIVIQNESVVNPLISENEIFEAMINYCEQTRKDAIRFFIDGRLHYGDISHWYPKKTDKDLRGYLNRLDEEFKNQTYAFALSFFQAFMSYEHWNLIRDFLYPINKKFGLPPGRLGCTIELFIGNYRKTPFGLHRDPESTFCFPIVGSKTMRVWKFNVFKNKPLHFFLEDYDKYLASSKVLVAKPGEFIYWPSGYWHVGENDGTSMISLHLSYSSEGELKPIVRNVLNHLVDESLASKSLASFSMKQNIPNELKKAVKKIKESTLSSLEHILEDYWLMKLSAQGFTEVPKKRKSLKLSLSKKVRVHTHFPIIYKLRDADLNLYLNGRSYVVGEKSAFLIALIKELNKGNTHEIREILMKYSLNRIDTTLVKECLNLLYENGVLQIVE